MSSVTEKPRAPSQTWWWIFWTCLIGARNPAGARHWTHEKLILEGWIKGEQLCPRRAYRDTNVDWWERNRWGSPLWRELKYWIHNGAPSQLASRIREWGWESARRRGFDRAGRIARWIGERFNWYTGGTTWRWHWQPRTCSYCGGAHPDDILRLIYEGWEVEETTKAYKRYIEPPRVGTQTLEGPYCAIHESDPIRVAIRNWHAVPPVKLYVQHFSDAQIEEFNKLLARNSPRVLH